MIVIADTGPLNYLVLIGDLAITQLHSTNFRLDPELERLLRHRISTEKRS
jgi:hypothetical protein